MWQLKSNLVGHNDTILKICIVWTSFYLSNSGWHADAHLIVYTRAMKLNSSNLDRAAKVGAPIKTNIEQLGKRFLEIGRNWRKHVIFGQTTTYPPAKNTFFSMKIWGQRRTNRGYLSADLTQPGHPKLYFSSSIFSNFPPIWVQKWTFHIFYIREAPQ